MVRAFLRQLRPKNETSRYHAKPSAMKRRRAQMCGILSGIKAQPGDKITALIKGAEMRIRPLAMTIVFAALAAFSVEERTALSTACEASLFNGKKRGQAIPPDLVINRKNICSCIARLIAADVNVGRDDKLRITLIYKHSAAGDMRSAANAFKQLHKKSNDAMRNYTKACSRYFPKPMKRK